MIWVDYLESMAFVEFAWHVIDLLPYDFVEGKDFPLSFDSYCHNS